MEMLKKTKSGESTQKYLKVAEVKEGTMIMKDGSLRGVVAVSSTNFSLKSEDEQNSISSGYQSMLNSLDFPIQILVHSRILDVGGYLEKLRGLAAGQTNELLRIQMNEYIEYVGKLVEYANIMSKTFYVIIPYSATPVRETWGSRIGKFFNPAGKIATSQQDFKKAKTRLDERVNHVVSELASAGLRSVVLGTEEIVELLYSSYNFETGASLQKGALEGLDIDE